MFSFKTKQRKSSPSRSAWCASSWLPVSTISIAFDFPTARTSRCVPPQPARASAHDPGGAVKAGTQHQAERGRWGGGDFESHKIFSSCFDHVVCRQNFSMQKALCRCHPDIYFCERSSFNPPRLIIEKILVDGKTSRRFLSLSFFQSMKSMKAPRNQSVVRSQAPPKQP